jgi:hypothetical protein
MIWRSAHNTCFMLKKMRLIYYPAQPSHLFFIVILFSFLRSNLCLDNLRKWRNDQLTKMRLIYNQNGSKLMINQCLYMPIWFSWMRHSMNSIKCKKTKKIRNQLFILYPGIFLLIYFIWRWLVKELE